MGGVEFKKDERDGSYKLIEFNARLGMWDSYGARCGVDIPYVAYRDAMGEPVEIQRQYREGVFWIDFQRDIRAFLLYRKQGLLSFNRWLKSFFVEKEWAVYSPDDWKPAWMAVLKLFTRPWDAIRRKVKF
jgi:predicted ATP-grasp superfamily ATP-dependent carboligase